MINNQKGSTLIMVLLVFSVVSIMGVTLLARASYSMNESKMEVDEQKAYYLAKSALNAAVSYLESYDEAVNKSASVEKIFSGSDGTWVESENVTSDLGSYNIRIQRNSNDEVEVSAFAYYGGASSKLSAKMEMIQEGGVFNNDIALGAHHINLWNTKVEGDVIIYKPNSSNTIGNVDITGKLSVSKSTYSTNIFDSSAKEVYIETEKGAAEQSPSITLQRNKIETLKVKSENSNIQVQDSKVNTVLVQSGGQVDIQRNDMSSLFLRVNPGCSSINIHANNRLTSGRIYAESTSDVSLYENKQVNSIWMRLKQEKYNSWKFQDNEGPEKLYIGGAKTLGDIRAKDTNPIETLFTDADSWINHSSIKNVEELTNEMKQGLEQELQIQEETKVFEAMKEMLEDKVIWDIPAGFEKISDRSAYTEYSNGEMRMVFIKSGQWLNVYANDCTSSDSSHDNYNYHIPLENRQPGRNEVVIFIDQQANGAAPGHITFKFENNDTVYNTYVYVPDTDCQMGNLPQVFEGGIIAREVYNSGSNNPLGAVFRYKPLEDSGDLGTGRGQTSLKFKGYQ